MKNKFNIIAVGVILIFLISFFIKVYLDSVSLKTESRYTIGYINDLKANAKAGFRIEFGYKVKGKQINTHITVGDYNSSIIGDRYYVKFSPSNPKNFDLLLNESVPSYIKDAPPEGWKEIP